MDRRKKGEYIGALGALLVHVAVIALLILVSFTVPQPDEDAGGVPVMLGNVDTASCQKEGVRCVWKRSANDRK